MSSDGEEMREELPDDARRRRDTEADAQHNNVKSVRIAAAQTFEYRDDIDATLASIAALSAEAEGLGVSMLCFPECFLQGYLLEEETARRVALDLGSPAFAAILQRLPASGPTLVFGMIESDGDRIFNTAVVVRQRSLIGRYRKRHLLRGEGVFSPGDDSPVFEIGALTFGIAICYDTNFAETTRRIADEGASLIVCPTNNMMARERSEMFRDLHNEARGERCRETGTWLISADVTGERDGRVCYGPTAVLNPRGEVEAQLALGRPGLLVFDLPV